MKKELKEWVKSRYKKGDFYYRVSDLDDGDYRITDGDYRITAVVDGLVLEGIGGYKVEEVYVDLDNYPEYNEYAIAYALQTATEAIRDDVWEKHRYDGVDRYARELDGTIGLSIISQYTMDDYDVEDLMIDEIENNYGIPPDEGWDWLRKNKHLEEKINEVAYDRCFEWFRDTWLPMISVDDLLLVGQADKGELMWDYNKNPLIFIPTNHNTAKMYRASGTTTEMVRLPLPCPLEFVEVGEMIDESGDFWN